MDETRSSIGRMGPLALVRQLVKEKKAEFKLTVLCLKLTLYCILLHVEVLGEYISKEENVIKSLEWEKNYNIGHNILVGFL